MFRTGWLAGVRRLRGGVLLTSTVLLASACGDSAPEPGEVRIEVAEGVPLGGAVLELSGEGLLEVQGEPGTRVVARTVETGGSKALPRLRVIVIRETPGPIALTVEVADRGSPRVGAFVVQASGADDVLLPTSMLPAVRVLR